MQEKIQASPEPYNLIQFSLSGTSSEYRLEQRSPAVLSHYSHTKIRVHSLPPDQWKELVQPSDTLCTRMFSEGRNSPKENQVQACFRIGEQSGYAFGVMLVTFDISPTVDLIQSSLIPQLLESRQISADETVQEIREAVLDTLRNLPESALAQTVTLAIQ